MKKTYLADPGSVHKILYLCMPSLKWRQVFCLTKAVLSGFK